jgi:hypothetical protein
MASTAPSCTRPLPRAFPDRTMLQGSRAQRQTCKEHRQGSTVEREEGATRHQSYTLRPLLAMPPLTLRGAAGLPSIRHLCRTVPDSAASHACIVSTGDITSGWVSTRSPNGNMMSCMCIIACLWTGCIPLLPDAHLQESAGSKRDLSKTVL